MHIYKKPDVNMSVDSCLGLHAFFLCKKVNCNSIYYWEKGRLSCCGNFHDLIKVYEEIPFLTGISYRQYGGNIYLTSIEGSTVAEV